MWQLNRGDGEFGYNVEARGKWWRVCVDSLKVELVATHWKRWHRTQPYLAGPIIETVCYRVGFSAG
uniref:Uncharacterized protein n=1 Tax=Physcomitrium patens TaxID=3218 RepID=A0A7I3Z7R1_PHYPA